MTLSWHHPRQGVLPLANDIQAAKEGNARAFERLIVAHQNVVYAIISATTNEFAMSEDLAQEVFLAAWTKLPTLKDNTRFLPWLRAIARNHANQHLRTQIHKRKHHTTVENEAHLSNMTTREPSGEQLYLREEQQHLLQQALHNMAVETRELFILYYHENKSISDAAAQLGLTTEAAKQRLSRGRKQLRHELETIFAESLHRTRCSKGFATAVMAVILAGHTGRIASAASLAKIANSPQLPTVATKAIPYGWLGAGMTVAAMVIAALFVSSNNKAHHPALSSSSVTPDTSNHLLQKRPTSHPQPTPINRRRIPSKRRAPIQPTAKKALKRQVATALSPHTAKSHLLGRIYSLPSKQPITSFRVRYTKLHKHFFQTQTGWRGLGTPPRTLTMKEATFQHPKGHFRLTLPKGFYLLQVQAKGHLPGHFTLVQALSQKDTHTQSLALLQRGNSQLQGTVVDPQGKAVSGAQVLAVPTGGARFAWQNLLQQRIAPGAASIGTSDQKGRFVLSHLPRGTYSLAILTKTHPTAQKKGIDLQASEHKNLHKIQLPPRACRCKGTVRGAAGTPLKRAFVIAVAFDASGKQHRQTSNTDGKGRFQFRQLHSGRVLLFAIQQAGPFSLSTKQSFHCKAGTTHTTSLQINTGEYHWKGTLYDQSNKPIPGAFVFVKTKPKKGEPTAQSVAKTDKQGRFLIKRLQQGTYHVQIARNGIKKQAGRQLVIGHLQRDLSVGEQHKPPRKTQSGVVTILLHNPQKRITQPTFRIKEDGTFWQVTPDISANTSFRITNLKPGNRLLRIEAKGFKRLETYIVIPQTGTKTYRLTMQSR
jgi:RNA polymerase sigma factor (sigma-70 family)